MTSVQLFAYEIDTHDQTIINALLQNRGFNPAEMSEKECLTMQANLQRDLIANHVVPLIANDVLPVFLAPEFFFKRHDGLPYGRATFFNCVESFQAMSAEFPEVLWILGTIWWQEPAREKGPGVAMVHNTAMILQNGRLLHSWQKNRLSQIDGLNQGPEIWDRTDDKEREILDKSQTPFFTAAVPGGRTLSCGIEICLDHLTVGPASPGVLRTRYELAHPNETGAGIDLHVLTAAGMPTQRENIVARDGGVFIRCDGGQGASPRSNSVGITRVGDTPETALHRWRPVQTRALVQSFVGRSTRCRLAIYPQVALA